MPSAPTPVQVKTERLKSPSRKERAKSPSPSRTKSPSRAKSPSGRVKSPSRAKSPAKERRTVKRRDDSAAAPVGDVYVVLFDYDPPNSTDGELKLRVGDVITKVGEEAGWFEGVNQATKEQGWLSPDFVQLKKPSTAKQ